VNDAPIDPPDAMSIVVLEVKLARARARLALAESMGRPAHIARCRRRVTALEIKINSLEDRR
jgi:hypothetical protein